jgi:3-(3-hydroxy-phenyl)propionate hydroxylase
MNEPSPTASSNSNTVKEVDVIVIGAGPAGLTMANYLGMYGVNTLLIEKNKSTVSEPRAVSIDDESLRAIQGIGLASEIKAKLMSGYGSNYLSPAGRSMAMVKPETTEYGFPRRNAFLQDVLEGQLYQGIKRFNCVETRFEHELVSFEQSSDYVTLNIESADGKQLVVRSQFVCACDGASSFIRQQLNVQMEGETYGQKWLIIDLLDTKDTYRHTKVYCNPKRAGICLPGPNKTRRFEFKLNEGETDEEVLKEENLRQLLKEHGPDQHAEIRRSCIYTFHARIADRWKDRRISLHGDAAHLTPPFAGQGMNSGIRDIHNYAWKLASVVNGDLGAGLLDSYQKERKPHALSLIEMAKRLGYVMMPKSRIHVVAMSVSFRLLKLIPSAYEYITQMKYKPKPKFKEGFFVFDNNEQSLVGTMFKQPEVRTADNQRILLDELLGDGFSMLIYSKNPANLLKKISNNIVGSTPVKYLCVVPEDITFPENYTGTYCRDNNGIIGDIFSGIEDCAVLLRPDRYVMASFNMNNTSQTLTQLKKLVEDTWKTTTVNYEVARKTAA